MEYKKTQVSLQVILFLEAGAILPPTFKKEKFMIELMETEYVFGQKYKELMIQIHLFPNRWDSGSPWEYIFNCAIMIYSKVDEYSTIGMSEAEKEIDEITNPDGPSERYLKYKGLSYGDGETMFTRVIKTLEEVLMMVSYIQSLLEMPKEGLLKLLKGNDFSPVCQWVYDNDQLLKLMLEEYPSDYYE